MPLLAEVVYSEELEKAFDYWQKAYCDFYLQLPLRAQLIKGDCIHEPKDRRTPLILAEDRLRLCFHQWLRDPALYDLQAEIVAATKVLEDQEAVDVFLTCRSKDIARLPWEAWEVGTDPEVAARVRFARSPTNIKQRTVNPLRRQARVLVIVGTAPELDLKKDLTAIESQLPKTVKVHIYQAELGKTAAEHLLDIQQLLRDPRSWDMLFFAGHSDESSSGGQLGLAPQVSIHMNELQESLEVARQHGLQFALFNSCNGLKIAEMLIQVGIGQVVVMRQPLSDQAAPEFLEVFLKQLAQYKDVHSALLFTCQYFRDETKRTQYPSLFQVPSLFRHPESQVFRIQPYGLQHKVQRWLPNRYERRWLAFLLLINLIPAVQDLMLEPRLLVQAIYQQTTGQTPKQTSPPVLLVEIDDTSPKQKALINDRYLNYAYLAKLIDQLKYRGAKVIGIDYILDKHEEQPAQAQSLQAAIQRAEEHGIQLVFGSYQENQKTYGISHNLANLQHHHEGNLNITEWVVALPEASSCKNDCPFAYQLARSFRQDRGLRENSVLHFVSKNSHAIFQNWFEPIIDFSIPEQTAYNRVSACSIMGSCPSELEQASLGNQVVLIAHGGYEQGGLTNAGDDIYVQPLARAYLGTQNQASQLEVFLGGEAHAYSVHHLLRQHLVIPVPDLLMTLLVVVISKGVLLFRVDHPDKHRQVLGISEVGTLIYILFSFQLYVSAAMLMPIGFPLLTYWLYMRLGSNRRNFYV